MAGNEHKNLLDANRHNPKAFETSLNCSFLGKDIGGGVADDDGDLSWGRVIESFVLACSDETTLLTTGTKVKFRMPYAFYVTAVRASLSTAATGGTLLTVDINDGGTTILSTKITIDASETTSTTAATAPVISDNDLADDAEISIDIDAIGSTNAGKGLKVAIIGFRTF
mgnify:CR=1 FL=1